MLKEWDQSIRKKFEVVKFSRGIEGTRSLYTLRPTCPNSLPKDQRANKFLRSEELTTFTSYISGCNIMHKTNQVTKIQMRPLCIVRTICILFCHIFHVTCLKFHCVFLLKVYRDKVIPTQLFGGMTYLLVKLMKVKSCRIKLTFLVQICINFYIQLYKYVQMLRM